MAAQSFIPDKDQLKYTDTEAPDTNSAAESSCVEEKTASEDDLNMNKQPEFGHGCKSTTSAFSGSNPTITVCSPVKSAASIHKHSYSTAFGGCAPSMHAGMVNNPFAPKPALRTDNMSTAGAHTQTTEGVLAPSRLGANPFMPRGRSSNNDSEDNVNINGSGAASKFVLRPSPLGPKALNTPVRVEKKQVIIKPARLQDPTQAVASDQKAESTELDNDVTGENNTVDKSNILFKESDSDSAKENSYVDDNVTTDTNLLLKSQQSGLINTKNEFLFGQNLSDRVTGLAASPSGKGQFVFGENLADRIVQSDKSSDEKSDDEDEAVGPKDDSKSPDKTPQTLEESAREYQARQTKPEYKEVEVVTGEEDESNVLQANCKLFLFDGTNQMWIEKGRGLLRLNDKARSDQENFHSRIVMRTQGTLCVILNCKIWPGMTVEKASEKSLRLTVLESDGIKVYLMNSNPKDTETMFRAIDWRIQQLKVAEEKELLASKKTEKRKLVETKQSPEKKRRLDKEGSDSNLDPETEASSESFTSSQTVCSETE